MRIGGSEFAVTGHWSGGFEERGLEQWAGQMRRQLRAPQVTLGLLFTTPRFFPYAAEVLEILRVHGQIPLLTGCSSQGLIVEDRELEEDAGLVLALYHFPGAELKAATFTQGQVEVASGPSYWHETTGVAPDQTNGWLVFADPFHIDGESWLNDWNRAYAPQPIVGGLASGESNEPRTQVYLNGEVYEEGGAAVSFGGRVGLASVISQGCTPIGETWTITKVEHNLIHEIGNRPAYEVLVETFNRLPLDQRKRAQNNLFVGLVGNEYQEEFHRGDFVIRNLLGGDPLSGILAVGALPRLGQSLQFQCRDAAAATEDMAVLLERTRRRLSGQQVYGGCLFTCNGRGRRFFGVPNHDAALTQRHFGPLALTGFFANGELGPVGGRSFLHGYSASLVLFVRK